MSKASAVHTIFPETMFQHHHQLFMPFLHQLGLDESFFQRPDSEMPLSCFVLLWELLGERVDQNIGLRIGAQASSHGLGAYGHVVRSASDITKALRCMSRFIAVHSQATRVEVTHNGPLVSIEYQIHDPLIFHRRQDSELSISMIAAGLREMTGREVYPLRVDFEHPQPSEIDLHRELFKCPVFFNQGSNRLHYPREILNLPVLTADARLHSALEPVLEEQCKQRHLASDLLSQISQAIALSLGTGEVSLEQVAKRQGMSARTLQRRLSERCLEFSVLVEDVRRALAVEYVSHSHYNLTEVALRLGYSEASSFSRAFRRWTQVTPQKYRQNTRGSEVI
ncbi:AraC-like transcriptional regulator QhpR [Pseudomonas veronii]|uniref:AraC-like transcriptional regulator QhpR n=1 Tax=Pseudomonas veronii TaxID=76761 RepID=UPI0021BEDA31|nr:AraC family transcriptional regulator [Pseudomonas veronii]MCT9826653.1 AraC family transcriptional regulator [Pseudomonas veronii]